MKKLTPEGQLKKSILEWLESQPNVYVLNGICAHPTTQFDTFVWVNRTVGIPDGHGRFRRNNQRGIADLSGIKKRIPFAAELKSHTGTVTPEQWNFLESFKTVGGVIGVIRSLDQFQDFFLKI